MAVLFNVDETVDDSTDHLPAGAAPCALAGRADRCSRPLVCFTLMVFYVFALQCVSTIVVVRRETGSWKWPLVQIAYMTSTAWLMCFAVRQLGLLLGFA
jgi:ferrous iron transport protein B